MRRLAWLVPQLALPALAGCATQGQIDELRREILDTQHELHRLSVSDDYRLSGRPRRADVQPADDLRRGNQAAGREGETQ